MTDLVYLAGPINMCTDAEARNWREDAKLVLGAENCLDPMRRDYRGREAENYQAIVEADKDDIWSSKIVLANCWKPGWGTPMEIHYAWSNYKPVVAVVPPDSKPSPWLLYHAHVFYGLQEALDFVRKWLNEVA